MNQTTTHILIVEDEAAHAELIRRAFDTEAEWASSVIVGTLREAQEYVTASMPDLMIVDLLLPDGNGTELLPGDREEAACPIVVMTSHGDEQVAVEAMKAGALDYVVKSETTLAVLPRTVKRVLREWNYLIERKQAEEALQASEEKYHSLFTSMLSGFAYHKIITDKQGHPEDYVFLEVNDAFESLTGLKKENIVGKKLTEAIPEIKDEAVDWIERYGQVALTGKEIKFEQYSEALNRWYSVSAYSPRKGYFAVVFDDITERKQLEEQLRQSQKMEAVGHMAGGMAHHFNNFLTVITGNVGLALADLPPSHPLAHDLQRIQRAAQRAADLTQQLLAFTRLQIAQLMVLDLNNLVVETSSTLRQLISEAIELAVLPLFLTRLTLISMPPRSVPAFM
jgi:PAS domain S-box-containing protein